MTSVNAAAAVDRPTSFLARIPGWVLFIAVACCWGMNTVAMRVAGRTVPPLSVASVRALCGGLLLVGFARSRGSAWPVGRAEWMGIAWIGLLMTGASTAGLFLAAKSAPAGVVSILSNTMPLFTALLAPVLLREKVRSQVAFGLAVGLLGTVIVAWRAVRGDVRPAGVWWGLVGASTAALGSIMYKKYPLPRLDRIMVVGVQLLISSVLLGVVAIPDDRSHMTFPWQFSLSFVYLVLPGLAMVFVLWSELLSRASSMQSSAAAYLATLFGVLFGAVLLGERLSWLVLVGGLVAIVGVALVQRAQMATASK